MIRKTLVTLNVVLATTITAIHAYDLIKYKLQKLAETETVHSSRQYILVRWARGDYRRPDGLETMVYDYRFYNIISKFHD